MDKKQAYISLTDQLKAMLDGQDDMITMMANTSALFMLLLNDINWVGYYLKDGSKLTLGPFQGRPACEKIKIGQGVCGRCAVALTPIIVDDVHQFAGHIACDSASNSEIVIPLFIYGELFGVLDIDSPLLKRFDATDQYYLVECAKNIQRQAARIVSRKTRETIQ